MRPLAYDMIASAPASRPLTPIEAQAQLPEQPHLTSNDRRWPDVTLDFDVFTKPTVFELPELDHDTVVIHYSSNSEVAQRRNGRYHKAIAVPGRMLLSPAGFASWWSTRNPHRFLCIRLSRQLLAQANQDIGTCPNRIPELAHVFDAQDDVVSQFSALLLGELDRPVHPAQRLIVDAASVGLAAHLLRSFDAFGDAVVKIPHGLGSRSLARALAYIEDHLAGPIRLDDLAGAANVSRFHFTRMFKKSTGVSPMFQLERSRVQRAQTLIERGGMTLVEVGLASGFSVQSHFTRGFRRKVGCTPSVYVRNFGAARVERR